MNWKLYPEHHDADILFSLVWFWFYGISTIVGYLMPNPFLYKLRVLFQTIQFRISTQFNVKNISIPSYSV